MPVSYHHMITRACISFTPLTFGLGRCQFYVLHYSFQIYSLLHLPAVLEDGGTGVTFESDDAPTALG